MTTGSKNRRVFQSEEHFVEFARFYLSSAFPNPKREGCPPDDALWALASGPTQADNCTSDHLTQCSPCFNAYMAHLAHARSRVLQSRRTHRASWLRRSLAAAATAIVVVITIYIFVARRHSQPVIAPRKPAPIAKPGSTAQEFATATYVPVLIDLSNASPIRGTDQRPSAQVIRLSPFTELTLELPLGSEPRKYSVRLSSNRHVAWSNTARAHLQNGQAVLHIQADFRHVPAGRYALSFVSNTLQVSVPVELTGTSSGRMP
jgi:hypothetical protein